MGCAMTCPKDARGRGAGPEMPRSVQSPRGCDGCEFLDPASAGSDGIVYDGGPGAPHWCRHAETAVRRGRRRLPLARPALAALLVLVGWLLFR